jgi:hypothetical protein
MPDNILFYVVFISQILLISFYYPRKILSKISYVLKTYPKSEYPKLYPKQTTYYQRGMLMYRVINIIILLTGFILLFEIGRWDYSSDRNISEAFPLAYFFIQMMPFIIMEISGFAYFKLMRKADIRTKRQAGLQPRRLFDFVSPISVTAAIVLFFTCIAFFYSLHQFQFNVKNDTFVIVITLTLSNLIFAGIIFWNLYGKKLDPYQASKDRLKQVEVTVKSLVFMSIAASLFLMVFEALDEFQLDYLEPVLMSLYFQMIIFLGLGALLRKYRVEDMNFDVYKEDASTT